VNRRESADLDRHITGNYGEDQMREINMRTADEFAMTDAQEQDARNDMAEDYLQQERLSEAALIDCARLGLPEDRLRHLCEKCGVPFDRVVGEGNMTYERVSR
jgi:hypothetical protein